LSANIVLNKKLTSLNEQLNELETLINNAVESINNLAESANNATSEVEYNNYVSEYESEKDNYESLLLEYESLGGEYNTTLEKYNTLEFSTKASAVSYTLPNPKDEHQWLAGNTFYNEKNAGGMIWSATNPLAPDERPDSKDLGLIINRGSYHSYLNEGFTEIQSTLKGFGFLDLFGDYTSIESIYKVEIKVTSSTDGSTLLDETKFIKGDGELDSLSEITNSNMGVDTIANILATPGMDLMSLNAMAVAQFTVTNLMDGKLFESGQFQLGNMLASSLYKTAMNLATQKITTGLVSALGIKSIYAAGILSGVIGVVLTEFVEIGLGLDNHFGFGGEIIGYDTEGNPVYGREVGFFEGLTDMFNSVIDSSYMSIKELEQANFEYEQMMYESDLLNLMGYTQDEIDNMSINTIDFIGPTAISLGQNMYGGWNNGVFSSTYQNKFGGFNSVSDAQAHHAAMSATWGSVDFTNVNDWTSDFSSDTGSGGDSGSSFDSMRDSGGTVGSDFGGDTSGDRYA